MRIQRRSLQESKLMTQSSHGVGGIKQITFIGSASLAVIRLDSKMCMLIDIVCNLAVSIQDNNRQSPRTEPINTQTAKLV